MKTLPSNRSGCARSSPVFRRALVRLVSVALIGLAFGVSAARGAANHRPTISWIRDQSIASDKTFAPQSFTVDDAETDAASLTVSVAITAVSPSGWLTGSNVMRSGTGANRMVNFATPAIDGAATVKLTVTDGGGKTSATSFTLRKGPVTGAAPIIQGVAKETIAMNGVYGPVPLVVEDDDTSAGTLTLSTDSGNVALVPVANIVFGGGNYARNVTVTPAAGLSGRTTITLTVSDGSNLTSTSFVLDVAPAGSTPPTINIDPTTYQAVALLPPNTSAPPISFTVGDGQTAVADLRVTATSSNIALVPNGNINFDPLKTGADRAVSVKPIGNVTGAATITLAVSDADSANSADFTACKQFLFVVNDPNALPMLFSRSSGVFILDNSNGTPYTTTFGKLVSLRDATMRDRTFVTGYAIRIGWDDLESSDTPGFYDFHVIDNALTKLPPGQRLSILISDLEPAYIASHAGVTTWHGTDGVLRAVPWDPYLRERRRALFAAMASFQVGGVPLAMHPRFDVLRPYLAGGENGIIDPPKLAFRDMPTYLRANLLMAVQDELRSAQDSFPGKLVQVGFAKVLDGENSNYAGLTAWQWIRGQLLVEFNGIVRPRVGFFMENLAAARLGPAIDPYSSTPTTNFAQPLFDSRNATWNSFQMLSSWTKPFNDRWVGFTINGTPNDAIEAAYNTYFSQYNEVYLGDIDNPAMQPALQSWHDYLASLTPADFPAALRATPVSSSQINVSWIPVYHGVSYELQHQQGTNGTWGTPAGGSGLTQTSFQDTGLTPSTTYFYRLHASNATATSLYTSVAYLVSATTLNSALQNWRSTYFGTTANSGNAADTADPDRDGISNLLEFATNTDPTARNAAPGQTVRNGNNLEFNYARSKAALSDGILFIVEWSDGLSPPSWNTAGVVETILSSNAIVEQVKAAVPAGNGGRRFVRLRVVASQ